MPEAYCFIMIGLLETCIQTGLIPSNMGYHHIFMASSVSAQITDKEGKPVFTSKNAVPISDSQRKQTEKEAVFIDENTVLKCGAIHGGRVYWTDDVRSINQLNKRLGEIGKNLAGENELLQAESRLVNQRAKTARQIRLYDSITALVTPQLEEIGILVSGLKPESPDFYKNMSHACVLNAYVKHRSNLALLSQKLECLSLDELFLCIRESADYLTQYGVLCSVWQKGTCQVSSHRIEQFYEGFESVVEGVLPALTVLLITLGVENGKPFLKLSMEGLNGFHSALASFFFVLGFYFCG